MMRLPHRLVLGRIVMRSQRLGFGTGTVLAAVVLLAACAADPEAPPGGAPGATPSGAGTHASHGGGSAAPPMALRAGERFVDLALARPYAPAAPNGGTDEYR